MVGKAGFEPAISRSRTGRDTRLRYFPKLTWSVALSMAVAWSRTEGANGHLFRLFVETVSSKLSTVASFVTVPLR